jgi:integrase
VLTDSKIKAAIARAEAEDKPVAVYDAGKTPGLELRANPGGRASWAYLYRPPGAKNRHRYRLGEYGTAFGLAEARRRAAELRDKRTAGIDPLAHRNQLTRAQMETEAAQRNKEAEEAARITMAKLAELFIAANEGLPWVKRYQQILTLNVVPILGARPAASIVRVDIQRVVDEVVERGARTQARRVFETTRRLLTWGVERDYLTGEPWRGVVLPERSGARERVLSAAELRWAWSLAERWIADDNGKAANQGRILRLLILTGQRSGEVNGMQHGEISRDLRTWLIPAARSKNGKAHTVPMPPLARQIVQEAMAAATSKKHVFVGKRGKPARPDDLAHDLADAVAGHNVGRREGDHLVAFVVHDVRRTVASGLEAMGVPITIISTALNHISTKAANVTTRHYAHADLSAEVRVALTRWQATIERVLAGDDPFTVRPEDIDELETRALAKGFGGPPHLRVVR